MEISKAYKKKALLLRVLLGFFIVSTIVCAVLIGIELNTIRQGREYYSTLTDDVEKNPRQDIYEPPDTLSPEPTVTPTAGATSGPAHTGGEEYVWVPYVDFGELNQRFRGTTAAWIFLRDTVIDYPVMQARDNDYFLRRLPDGSSHRNGSIFLDYRCSPDFTDKNTLIYGHNMRSGDMFGVLKEYHSQSFYQQHPVVYIYTADRDYAVVLFAGYILDSAFEVPPLRFRDEGAFTAYIADVTRRSVFRSEVEVSADDRIVCLATCDSTNSSNRNLRLIIVGKLVDLGPFDSPAIPSISPE